MSSLFLELSKQQNLLKMMEERGFTLWQQNGQRTYGGPPPNWGSRPPPSRDCEVFIGRLPRMCFEDELIPLFLTAGELYEFRLMLDFSGTNRGYGYAHYATKEGAARAIEKLNKYEIRPGHQIGVLRSKNNCRLLFGNITPGMSLEGFKDFIRTVTDRVLNILMFKSFQQLKRTNFSISSEMEKAFLCRVPHKNRNHQFAIVEYENHKAAAVARRVLIPKFGNVWAIDWAVPPRERKRFSFSSETHSTVIEKPLANSNLNDSSNLFMNSLSKIRPVPVLVVQPSPLESVSFMPKHFHKVVKFFKYLLSVYLYKSVGQLEIPFFLCKEIERKIVERITNLDNCSQSVQLILNYFSWYDENKGLIISSDVTRLMEEVKAYSDVFVQFVNRRLKFGPLPNALEDNYYINVLPLHLNVLFRIILRSDGRHQAKLSSGISQSLKFLFLMMEKGDKATKDFIAEIFQLVENEDGASLEKASTLAKSVYLNAIMSSLHIQSFSKAMDLPCRNALPPCANVDNLPRLIEPPLRSEASGLSTISPKGPYVLPKIPNVGQQKIKVDSPEYNSVICAPSGRYERELNSYPSVPLLLVQPSITNNIPFMPKIFKSVLAYFKHLIRVCLNMNAWQSSIPQHICNEIERKIIDRISNMENCAEGVQLILNYFTWWVERRHCIINTEVLRLLQEVKSYADAFVSFTWNKTLSCYQLHPESENYFCNVLPMRLNLLFQMMLIFNSENPMKFLIGISKGLTWLEELIATGDLTAKEFIEELTRFVLDPNPTSYDRIQHLGKAFCEELMNSDGQLIKYPGVDFPSVLSCSSKIRKSLSSSSFASVSSTGSSTFKNDNSPVGLSEFEF